MSIELPAAGSVLLAVVEREGWEAAHGRYRSRIGKDLEPALGDLLAGWFAVEQTRAADAEAHLSRLRDHPQLSCWAALGEAMLAVRVKNFPRAEEALSAAELHLTDNAFFAGTIAHIRGAKAAHEGRADAAREFLFSAVALLTEKNYAYGRVLDALANQYLNQDDFLTAKLLFARALEHKTRVNDRHGMAQSHGGLGRLHLYWGYLDRAEQHFLADLQLAEELNDEFGRTRMQGALGQVHTQTALNAWYRRYLDDVDRAAVKAADWLRVCIQESNRHGFHISEGFAHKDSALLHLVKGDFPAAEREAAAAREIFTRHQFAEGLSHIDRVEGMILAEQGRWSDARSRLRASLAYFAKTQDRAEAAYTKLQLARVAARAAEPAAIVEQAFEDALRAAEAARRTSLVRDVEDEFRASAPAAYWNQIFRRVRGRGITDGASSFTEGTRETATVFFLDLQGWSNFAHGRDPEEVMMTINQLMSEAADVMRRYETQSISWRGDGFLALSRGANHARRAVDSALDLVAAIDAFNKPRMLLGLPEFLCRVGVSTGEVLLGNVGTYEKMDYTGVGTTTNLGARLEAKAEPSKPCISRGTYELVRQYFEFAEGSPRTIECRGIGDQPAWDVVGRKAAR